MFFETLPKKTAALLKELKDFEFLQAFYLSGGTALALQLGHRESEDLDFFCPKNFSPLKLLQGLEKIGPLKEVQIDKNTLNLFLSGVQLQFLTYPYPLLKPYVKWNKINLASIADIACTKLQTVAARGSKKDFIDLWFITKKYSLKKLFLMMKKKYRQANYSQTHILKSLVYFVDAEKQPMPRMHRKVSWEKIKKDLVKIIRNFEI